MKTKRVIFTIIFLTLLGIACALADTLCVTISPSDMQRTAAAYGEILGLKNAGGQPRAATNIEIEGAIAAWVAQSTQDYERRKNMKEFVPPPFQQPTPGGKPAPTQTKKK